MFVSRQQPCPSRNLRDLKSSTSNKYFFQKNLVVRNKFFFSEPLENIEVPGKATKCWREKQGFLSACTDPTKSFCRKELGDSVSAASKISIQTYSSHRTECIHVLEFSLKQFHNLKRTINRTITLDLYNCWQQLGFKIQKLGVDSSVSWQLGWEGC